MGIMGYMILDFIMKGFFDMFMINIFFNSKSEYMI